MARACARKQENGIGRSLIGPVIQKTGKAPEISGAFLLPEPTVDLKQGRWFLSGLIFRRNPWPFTCIRPNATYDSLWQCTKCIDQGGK